MAGLEFRVDDLSGSAVRDLVHVHLAGMYATSPAESVFALDIDALRHPDVTFWSGWRDGSLVAIGALHLLDPTNAELKSMRVATQHLGTGAGRAILRHIVDEASARGIRVLWLETGSSPEFTPARRLYAQEGFVVCGPFADYPENPFSVFMTRTLG
jgi:putative acetyltransferase